MKTLLRNGEGNFQLNRKFHNPLNMVHKYGDFPSPALAATCHPNNSLMHQEIKEEKIT
jgi:hypothetical protein